MGWGDILHEGYNHLVKDNPHVVVIPLIGISLDAAAYYLVYSSSSENSLLSVSDEDRID